MVRNEVLRLLGSCTAPGPCVLLLRPHSTPLSPASPLPRDLKASAVPEKRRVMLPVQVQWEIVAQHPCMLLSKRGAARIAAVPSMQTGRSICRIVRMAQIQHL